MGASSRADGSQAGLARSATSSSVSGITRSSEVRFAGLPVGQVQELDLDPLGSGMVRVRLEIAAQTPVRIGSVATLEAQAVTGTSIVSISPGRP